MLPTAPPQDALIPLQIHSKPEIHTVALAFISKQSKIQMVRDNKLPLFCATDILSILLHIQNTKEMKMKLNQVPHTISSRFIKKHIKGKKDATDLLADHATAVDLVEFAFNLDDTYAEHKEKILAVFNQCVRIKDGIEVFKGGNIRICFSWPEPLLSLIDVVRVICGRDDSEESKMFATKKLFDLQKSKPDVIPVGNDIQFFGQGQRDTPCANFKTATKLINHLDGDAAAVFREKTMDIIQRYIAGDPTLHAEIDRNARDNGTAANLAREGVNAQATSRLQDHSQELDEMQHLAKRIRLQPWDVPMDWSPQQTSDHMHTVNHSLTKMITLSEKSAEETDKRCRELELKMFSSCPEGTQIFFMQKKIELRQNIYNPSRDNERTLRNIIDQKLQANPRHHYKKISHDDIPALDAQLARLFFDKFDQHPTSMGLCYPSDPSHKIYFYGDREVISPQTHSPQTLTPCRSSSAPLSTNSSTRSATTSPIGTTRLPSPRSSCPSESRHSSRSSLQRHIHTFFSFVVYTTNTKCKPQENQKQTQQT